MDRSEYFASLTRAEHARCADHQHSGYGGAFGTQCRDCIQAQSDALSFFRAQRQARTDESLDLFALAGQVRTRGAETGLELVA